MTAQPSAGVTASPSSTNHDAGFGRFFLPGPTEVRPSILQEMLRPMIGHRGKGMEDLIARIEPDLQYVFRTKRPVYIASSSATGLMEGAIRNGVRSRVLCLVNGAFSERFFQIARACGVEAEALTVPLGQVHTPEMLEAALKGGRFDAVTVVHSETSTGALNPIAELTRVAHERVVQRDDRRLLFGGQLQRFGEKRAADPRGIDRRRRTHCIVGNQVDNIIGRGAWRDRRCRFVART